MRRVVLLASLPVLAMVAAGCRHDGRTLRPAGPNQNLSISTTALVTTTTVQSLDTSPASSDNPALGTDGVSTTSGG